MATIRPRGRGFEAVIRRKQLLPRPISLMFDTEAAAQEYCTRLESLLDAGIVPPEIQQRVAQGGGQERLSLGALIRRYREAAAITPDDDAALARMVLQMGGERDLTVAWADAWVSRLKRVDGLAPGTVRKRVGTLSRCLDWCVRQGLLVGNPLASLPRGYSTYTPEDTQALGTRREDVARDRRLQPGEEEKLMAVLTDPAERLLVVLALETAMRMREIYTLTIEQVDLTRRTVYLEKTKNGSKRQVPLSTVALEALTVAVGDRATGRLFPWDVDETAPEKTTWKLSRMFGRRVKQAGLSDLRFHDLRHEATSRLFERTRLTDAQIAKITGHKDPRMLLRYANLRGSDLANALW